MRRYGVHVPCGHKFANCTCTLPGGLPLGIECLICGKVHKPAGARTSVICSHECHVQYVMQGEHLTRKEAEEVIRQE